MTSSEFEISQDLNLLKNQSLTYKDFSLNGVKLFAKANSIDIGLITGTRMEPLPENSSNWSLENDEKVYIVQNNIRREFTLAERVEAIINDSGRLFTKNNFGYGIKEGKVVEFIILEYWMHNFSGINRDNIEKEFGKADSIEEDYDYQHGQLMHNYFIYEARKMKVRLDEWDNMVDSITLGEEL